MCLQAVPSETVLEPPVDGECFGRGPGIRFLDGGGPVVEKLRGTQIMQQPIELSRYRYSAANPFAPPDRRFRLARSYRAQGLTPSFRRDDPLTWKLWRFLKRLDDAYEPDQRAQLLVKHRDLSIAFQLHHGDMQRLRPPIEAYILADADDGSIAKRLAVPMDAIRWFRLAFYDIKHLRQAPLRVILDLIGIADEDGESRLDPHRVWKLIGYTLKSGALDLLFRDAKSDMEAFKVGGLAAWFARQAQLAIENKKVIAMSNLNADDPKHVAALLNLVLQQQRNPRQSETESLTTEGRGPPSPAPTGFPVRSGMEHRRRLAPRSLTPVVEPRQRGWRIGKLIPILSSKEGQLSGPVLA
jgi:hypothetical protein